MKGIYSRAFLKGHVMDINFLNNWWCIMLHDNVIQSLMQIAFYSIIKRLYSSRSDPF